MIYAPNTVPGYGFKKIHILKRSHSISTTGRSMPEKYKDSGKWFWGILAAASPKDIELYRQNQHPVTHTIVQHGTIETADEENLLYVEGDGAYSVSVKPSPKGIDTTMIYHVEERRDLNERIEWNCSGDGGQDKNSNSAENAEGC